MNKIIATVLISSGFLAHVIDVYCNLVLGFDPIKKFPELIFIAPVL